MTALTITSVLKVARTSIGIAGLLSFACCVALAQDSRKVYLPMTFKAETKSVRTTACFEVSERIYSAADWRKEFAAGNGAERAFAAVIAAMKRKDRVALLNLSDPTQGRDPKRFDRQAMAFFQQLGAMDIVSVPRAYEFDGLVVFFAKMQSKNRTFFAPLTFTDDLKGSFGFLPYRTEWLTYRLLQDWFNAPWGPALTDTPAYCSAATVSSATHRIPLANSADTQKEPSYLLLKGTSIETQGELARIAGEVTSTFKELNTAMAGPLDDLFKHMTPNGGDRLKAWFVSANQTERNAYKAALGDQKPLFLFDASPLVVVYTKPSVGPIQVMYFTSDAANELLWANSSHITLSDKVFKNGPVYDSVRKEVSKVGAELKVKD